MFQRIRESRFSKIFTIILSLVLVQNITGLNSLFAITGGPSQPEVQSFEPAGTNQMVDLFSGDFTYNIPLFDLPGPNGGYPFNLAYHSGIGMDQEATWVGLGWSLNPGAIVRNVRGLPDDFNGDAIKQHLEYKPNWTAGLNFGADLEVFGAELDKAVDLGLTSSLYYNSYRGVGYGIGFNVSLATGSNTGLGLGLKTDSQGGAGIDASFSTKEVVGDNESSTRIGLGLSSRGSLSLSMDHTESEKGENRKGEPITRTNTFSSNLSFSHQSFVPSFDHETIGSNLSGSFNTGAGLWGIFGDVEVGFFFNSNSVKDSDKEIPAYGYMHLETPFENNSGQYLLDFDREKDGLVTHSSPNLAIPNLTYDYYALQGQGIGGMFRPFRGDIGHVHDPVMESKEWGGSLGVDLAVHFGVQGSFSNGVSEISDFGNGFEYTFQGVESSDNVNYEPVYFKQHGDLAAQDVNPLASIGDEEPVYIPVDGGDYQNKLITKSGEEISSLDNRINNGERMPRSTVVQQFTNKELSYNGLGEFMIEYNNGTSLDRMMRENNSISNHIGGISALTTEGMRYIYGIPAYNLEQKEYLFSVDSDKLDDGSCHVEYPLKDAMTGGEIDPNVPYTDKYLKRTETPPYAHSYLLTSILGADYVDVDYNGPSEKDLGYWVKFNYKKINDYSWRAPYKNANYAPGMLSFGDDDKASFMWGTKEIWYLESVETKTHIAIFKTSERPDGKGAEEFNQVKNPAGVGVNHQLDNIAIYSKKDMVTPLKQVYFKYSNTLCPGVENNSAGGGKLTLEKLWFTYQNSTQGELAPYEFVYDNNRAYDPGKYDRWGNYNSNADVCDRVNAPYTEQGHNPTRDEDAAAWHMSEIHLPSGGHINIEYESDDYAYVQHKTATQMMKIYSMRTEAVNGTVFSINWDREDETGNVNDRRVYVELEHPYTGISEAEANELFRKQYLDGLASGEGATKNYQVYFKIKSKIRGNVREYVAGYADLDMSDYGVVSSEPENQNDTDSDNNFTKAYISLKALQVDTDKEKFYHPFAAAAWQFIRTSKPDLMVAPGSFDKAEPGSSDMDKYLRAKSLLSVFNEVRDIFRDYTSTAYAKKWGDELELDKSMIRLCSPDKIKYGGGSRVKQISMSDNWDLQTGSTEDKSEYGQVYDYTIEEEGQIISSGVAAYEPMIGGDENALRKAKKYSNNVLFKSPNNLYFEYPVNENLYPGASVGYRKVTVRSMATDGLSPANSDRLSSGGITTHEFYTHKDFPIMAEETEMKKNPHRFPLPIFIPFIGQLETHNLNATQGYSIKLNDMHGKPKSVTSYMSDKNGDMAQEVSRTEYIYKKNDKFYDDEYVSEVDNTVEVFLDHRAGSTKTAPKELGTQVDFVADMRHNRHYAFQGGLNFNVDILPIIIPITVPVPWPTISSSEKNLKTAVTNKVIFRPGILETVITTDGASTVRMDNVLFDEATGQPLLTKVTNNFDNPIYNLGLPAYKEYEGMARAYENAGMVFEANVQATGTQNIYTLTPDNAGVLNYLAPGDELHYAGSGVLYSNSKLTVIKKQPTSVEVSSLVDWTGNQSFKVVRSGKRNMLTASVGNVTALANPLETVTSDQCGFSLNVADEVKTIYTAPYYRTRVVSSLPDSSIPNTLIMAEVALHSLGRPCIQRTYFGINIKPEWQNLDIISAELIVDREFSRSVPIRDDIALSAITEPWQEGVVTWLDNISYTNTRVYYDILKNNPQSPTISFDIKNFLFDWLEGNLPNYGLAFHFYDETIPESVSTSNPMGPIVYVDRIIIKYRKKETSQFISDHNLIDNVINISAVTYSDIWLNNNTFISPSEGTNAWLANNTLANPYETGEKGVWLLEDNYVYVNDRSQSSSINLSVDGVANDVPYFDWQNLYFPLCQPDWKLTERITKVNQYGYPTESKDILGRYSLALYGYSGGEVVMVSTNASKDEVAFEGFEDNITNSVSSASTFRFTGGNINFSRNSSSNIDIARQYEVLEAAGADALVNIPYDASNLPGTVRVYADLEATGSRARETVIADINVDVFEGISDENSIITLTNPDTDIFTLNRLWKGKVFVMESKVLPNSSNLSVVSNVSHTGNNSLQNTGSSVHRQKLLALKPGKEYEMSAWINSDTEPTMDIYLYNNSNQQLTEGITINDNHANGIKINGWKRYSRSFIAPQGTYEMELRFNGDFYIDDIRIYPKNSSVKTYVYNPENLRLTAVLDENNYATLYYYDEQGNLFLVKKETEEGIVTLQESGSFLPGN